MSMFVHVDGNFESRLHAYVTNKGVPPGKDCYLGQHLADPSQLLIQCSALGVYTLITH